MALSRSRRTAELMCRFSICRNDHVFHPFADIPHGSRSPDRVHNTATRSVQSAKYLIGAEASCPKRMFHDELSGLPRLDAARRGGFGRSEFPNATGIVRVARGYMGTGGIEHWRIARQAAGDAPAPVRAPQEQGAPRIANG
jgi:hypothetical protein